MSTFLQALRSGRVLLMDGAMGTELQRAGVRTGECYELNNLTHPERVLAIHRGYVEAGAECLLTNTFQATPLALSWFGLEDRLEAMVTAAVELARAAAGPDRFVLGSVGPVARPEENITAELLRPLGRADAILVETCSDLHVFHTIRRAGVDVPVLLSLTYLRDDSGALRTFLGRTPEQCARAASEAGVAVLGVNCGRDISIADCAEIVARYRAVCDLPVLVRPNAGTPVQGEDGLVYPHTPETMARELPPLLEAGVRMVGGCCGTTPEHVRAFRGVIARTAG